jgi:succinyl-diaminopimelate desuccinylase
METKLIEKLVGIKTVSGDNTKCLEALKIIKDEVKLHEIPCKIIINNGFPILLAGNLEKSKFAFLSHIDVVPATNQQFNLIIKDNIAIGRGILDMKGPMVVCLESFIKLWKIGIRDFLFIITCDEEIGGFNGVEFLLKDIFKKMQLVIVPDGTNGEDLVINQKAPFHIRLKALGKSAHGSRPDLADNAGEKLIRCCDLIINKINNKSQESTTAALTQFHSGSTTNTIPNEASATIDIRILRKIEVNQLIDQINEITNKMGCTWRKIDKPMFFEVSKNNVFVKKWVESFEKINGHKPKFKIESGASDARFLSDVLDIPVIVTSVIGGGAHSEFEWADINSLDRLSKIVFDFAKSISKLNISL